VGVEERLILTLLLLPLRQCGVGNHSTSFTTTTTTEEIKAAAINIPTEGTTQLGMA